MVMYDDVSYVQHRVISFKGEACHDENFQHLVNSHNLPLVYHFEPKYKSSYLNLVGEAKICFISWLMYPSFP